MNRLRIIDLLTKKNSWNYYCSYKETQWYSVEQMREYQLKKLKLLINHCYENVPYYRDYMDKIKLTPKDFNSIECLKDFPILTKEIIKDNYELFIPKNIGKLKGVKTSQTGGTTGSILYKRTDANVRSSTLGTYIRFFDWMGVESGDRTLRLMGGHVVKGGFIHSLKEKINSIITITKSINPYDKTDDNIRLIARELGSNRYKLLKGYSQNLYFLSQVFQEMGVTFSVPCITTTAEPLMDEHRNAFKKVFGSESFDQYGCGEIGGIAYECNHHNGLHVAEERVILEINDVNELIITDLDNFSMPYLRYWNADQAIPSKEFCSCGRKSLLLKSILGRTCDYISSQDGKQLHWAYFWHLLFDTNIAVKRNMKKFQILQRSLSRIDFRIVSDPLTEEDKKILLDNMKSNLGDVSINFINETDIENSASGKYRPVINLTL